MTTTFSQDLREAGACGEAIGWTQQLDENKAWKECHDGAWLYWLIGEQEYFGDVLASFADVVDPEGFNNDPKYLAAMAKRIRKHIPEYPL